MSGAQLIIAPERFRTHLQMNLQCLISRKLTHRPVSVSHPGRLGHKWADALGNATREITGVNEQGIPRLADATGFAATRLAIAT
jgi:hypothetical protein